jgi:hypothetical protein
VRPRLPYLRERGRHDRIRFRTFGNDVTLLLTYEATGTSTEMSGRDTAQVAVERIREKSRCVCAAGPDEMLDSFSARLRSAVGFVGLFAMRRRSSPSSA